MQINHGHELEDFNIIRMSTFPQSIDWMQFKTNSQQVRCVHVCVCTWQAKFGIYVEDQGTSWETILHGSLMFLDILWIETLTTFCSQRFLQDVCIAKKEDRDSTKEDRDSASL